MLLEKGTIGNFTLLVGIPLRKIKREFCGNLIVFPRSHFVLEEYFQKNGFVEAKENGLCKKKNHLIFLFFFLIFICF